MNKNTKIVLIMIVLLVVIGVFYFNMGSSSIVDISGITLPANYTLDSYTVAEKLDILCNKSIECVTPNEYLIRSNCPYTSLCINNKCNVVCPEYKAPDIIVGGDKDKHGCLGSAGYSWCEANQKCLRVWEEKCGTGSPLNATYIIEGKEVALYKGIARENVATDPIITKVFGVPVEADLNADGIKDYVMFLTRETSGSGTFFYVVVALTNKVGNVLGTNAVFLGDRIAPQNINVEKGIILANYVERKASEPFTTKPSLGVTKRLQVVDGVLKEIKDTIQVKTNCEKLSGVWYPLENICEVNQLSKKECVEKGGEYNPCASACRHDPKAEVCTLQCVLTCTIR